LSLSETLNRPRPIRRLPFVAVCKMVDWCTKIRSPDDFSSPSLARCGLWGESRPSHPDGHGPAYRELRESLGDPFTPDLHPAGWRLEHFVADLLLDCETGYIAESRSDGGLNYIFNRRNGPIAAALAVTLDAPP
jgi:hypothetical protein